MNNAKVRGFVIGGSLFYAVTVAYLSLYLYPVWREMQYEQHSSRVAIAFDYLGLSAVVFVLAMFVPFVLAMPFRRNPLGWAAVFFIAAVALQAAYFMYSGLYYDGRPPRFTIEFHHVSFLAEFRNLKMVFTSPLTAATALAIAWSSRRSEVLPGRGLPHFRR